MPTYLSNLFNFSRAKPYFNAIIKIIVTARTTNGLVSRANKSEGDIIRYIILVNAIPICMCNKYIKYEYRPNITNTPIL